MDANFFGEIALGQSGKIFDSARAEARDERFIAHFRGELDRLILIYATQMQLPPASINRLTQEEGPAGVIPSGAKPTILRSVLAGEPMPPLRVSYSNQPGPEDHRLINQVVTHFLVEVGVGDMMHKGRIGAVIRTLEAMRNTVGTRNLVIPDPKRDSPDLLIGDLSAKLHIVRRSGLGGYKFYTDGLDTPQDIDLAIENYRSHLVGTLDFDPNSTVLESDVIAYDQLNQKLSEHFGFKGSGLELPVVLQPSQFGYIHGYQLGDSYKNIPMLRVLGNAPFIMVSNSGVPEIVKYDLANRSLEKVGEE